MILEDEK
jgi:hypothetical protein